MLKFRLYLDIVKYSIYNQTLQTHSWFRVNNEKLILNERNMLLIFICCLKTLNHHERMEWITMKRSNSGSTNRGLICNQIAYGHHLRKHIHIVTALLAFYI